MWGTRSPKGLPLERKVSGCPNDFPPEKASEKKGVGAGVRSQGHAEGRHETRSWSYRKRNADKIVTRLTKGRPLKKRKEEEGRGGIEKRVWGF